MSMRRLPDHVRPYRKTAEFTETTVPDGLLRDHATKPGVWGLIHVAEGRLLYELAGSGDVVELTAGGPPGVVEPEARHKVTPIGAVRFHVEFWR